MKDTWPAGGPRVIWKRPLGDGYSSPIVEDGLLYTMYGRGRDEVVIAADAEKGTKTLWQERSIEKAAFVRADGKLITLDQDGNLMIAHPSPQGFKIAAKAPLRSRLAWTPPVLVGSRVYLRDRRDMMSVDLA